MKCLMLVATALLILALSETNPVHAAEYFVSLQGDDAHDGRTRETAFRTVQRGVDALAPGDTLTLRPGEYFESLTRAGVGSDDAETIIRAEISGTAVLRGDVAAPPLTRHGSTRFVYTAALDQDPVAVLEIDTLKSLRRRLDIQSVEFEPGTFYYDADTQRLYLSSTDLRPPTPGRYSISVTATSGLLLEKPRRVTITGLATRGFYPHESKGYNERHYVGGIVLHDPVGCTVRDCTVLLNGQGVCMVAGDHNAIEACIGYGNGSPFHNQGGNFIIYNANHAAMRNNLSYASAGESIKFYSGFSGPALLEGNISWGTWADYYIKGDRAPEFGLARNNIGLGTFVIHNVSHNLVGDTNHYNREMSSDNVQLPGLDREAEFADPLNLDYRLQATSSLRGTGPDGVDRGPYPFTETVFYVSPTGDDGHDGLSTTHAWRTLDHALARLEPGDTLYLLEGDYTITAPLTLDGRGGEPIHLRGRGIGTVRITSKIDLTACHGLTLERLNFMQPVTITDSSDIEFRNDRFFAATTGLAVASVHDLQITHCEFTGFADAGVSVDVGKKQDATPSQGLLIRGNIFDNTRGLAIASRSAASVIYSDYNCFADADRPWRIGSQSLALTSAREAHRLETYSTILAPTYRAADPLPVLENRDAFAALGPAGTPAGFMVTHPQREIGFAGPFLHTVSDTTANVEWWTSATALCEVAWGKPGEPMQSRELFVSGFGTLSLTGLEPGATYEVRIRRIDPSVNPAPDRNFYLDHLADTTIGGKSYIYTHPLEPEAATLTLTTAANAAAPRTYYVASDGNNANSGLSRGDAWGSVGHAAATAAPGDTVLIAGGTYAETVRVRVSGDGERRIRFTPIPGEKVAFTGLNGILNNAFIVAGKRGIDIDGFYFSGFAFAGPYASSIFAYQSDDVRITRCFLDGRQVAYNSPFLEVWACRGLLVQNCVIMQAMNTGMAVHNSPETRIEHNVFFRNFTGAATLVNRPEQKVYVSHNVITDLTRGKEKVRIIESPEIDALVFSDNCYVLRTPPEERAPVFHFYRSAGRLKLTDYMAQGGDRGSVAMDPRFQGALDLPASETPRFIPDVMIREKALDFPALFVTEPSLVERGIGLIPSDFADLHFHGQAP